MKLSIIIPVYGVEKYILDFAKSLFPQLTCDVELIVIDDGTKDESIYILKKYLDSNQFSNINILLSITLCFILLSLTLLL